MKFLLIIKPRTVPPAAVLRAHKEWVLAQAGSGGMDVGYCFAASVGGMAIVNADNTSQLNDLFFQAPAGPFCDIEVHALVDFSEQMERVAVLLEKNS
jgi:hypothetical protein